MRNASVLGIAICLVLNSCGKRYDLATENPALEDVRTIVEAWPAEPAEMTIDQLKDVTAADEQFRTAIESGANGQQSAGMEARIGAAQQYLGQLREAVAADAEQALREALGGSTVNEYLRRQWDDRHSDWEKAAALEFSDGQWVMGRCYQTGVGVDVDFAEASRWLRRAAEQGHADAMTGLGVIYTYGRGVDVDFAEANRWFRRAAEQGHPLAMYNLGYLYENGKGVEVDRAEAMRWLRQAAQQGYAKAMNDLGAMYERGLGAEVDYAEAMQWYRQAAEEGHAMGIYNLGYLYEKGRGVDVDYAEAMRWYRQAAQQGNAYAMNGLGVMYELGNGVDLPPIPVPM